MKLYLDFPCRVVMYWMLESTVANKKVTDIAKACESFFTVIFSTTRNFPMQFMSVCHNEKESDNIIHGYIQDKTAKTVI